MTLFTLTLMVVAGYLSLRAMGACAAYVLSPECSSYVGALLAIFGFLVSSFALASVLLLSFAILRLVTL